MIDKDVEKDIMDVILDIIMSGSVFEHHIYRLETLGIPTRKFRDESIYLMQFLASILNYAVEHKLITKYEKDSIKEINIERL